MVGTLFSADDELPVYFFPLRRMSFCACILSFGEILPSARVFLGCCWQQLLAALVLLAMWLLDRTSAKQVDPR